MKFVLASGNRHKAQEISAMFSHELVLQTELGVNSAEETGTTFVENAIIKARHASRKSGLPSIADDSGICVAALDGAPGIYSARYAGENASDEQNLRKLIDELGDHPDRTAFFQCVLVCMRSESDPSPLIASGQWHGLITSEPAGKNGFGYDPVFLVPEFNCTAAELPAERKNQISHRGLALAKLKQLIDEHYPA